MHRSAPRLRVVRVQRAVRGVHPAQKQQSQGQKAAVLRKHAVPSELFAARDNPKGQEEDKPMRLIVFRCHQRPDLDWDKSTRVEAQGQKVSWWNRHRLFLVEGSLGGQSRLRVSYRSRQYSLRSRYSNRSQVILVRQPPIPIPPCQFRRSTHHEIKIIAPLFA